MMLLGTTQGQGYWMQQTGTQDAFQVYVSPTCNIRDVPYIMACVSPSLGPGLTMVWS